MNVNVAHIPTSTLTWIWFKHRWVHVQGLPAGSATLSFAEDLLSRIPQTSAAPNAYRLQERAAAELVRRNASYSMVLDEDEDDAAPAPADLPAPTTGKTPKQKEKHVRKSKVRAGACCTPALH